MHHALLHFGRNANSIMPPVTCADRKRRACYFDSGVLLSFRVIVLGNHVAEEVAIVSGDFCEAHAHSARDAILI